MFRRKRSSKKVSGAAPSPGAKMPLAKSFPFQPVAIKHEDSPVSELPVAVH